MISLVVRFAAMDLLSTGSLANVWKHIHLLPVAMMSFVEDLRIVTAISMDVILVIVPATVNYVR